MEEKCVLYVRVSSDLQDYERQITDLKKFAEKSNLTIPQDGIFEDKLSGFKDEKERIGLQELKEYCLKFQIKKVLIWEISRLARKQVILHNLKEFFYQNGINLYFFNVGKWFLDDKGEITGDASLMITMVGWQSEYETKLMQERFKSRKLLNESIGKYNGGKIPFGYKLDKENKYVLNDDVIDHLKISEVDIVKEVFALYENGMVCSKICRLCKSKEYPKIVTNTHTLARLLRNTSYIGYKNVALGKRTTPSIITEQQFYNVNSLIDQNKTKADKGRKHVYLLRGVLHCSHCGASYVGKQTDDCYICPQNSGSNKTNKQTSCKGENITISNLDGIIWSRIKFWLTKWKVNGFVDEDIELKSKINDLNAQINRYQSLADDLEKQKCRMNFIFKNDGYTPEEYKKEITKNRNEKDQVIKEIALLNSEIKLLNLKDTEYESMKKRIENINAIVDRNQMKGIIKAVVKDIRFHKISLSKSVIIINYYKLITPECIVYNSMSKKGNKYKLISLKYFRFDPSNKSFYAIKEPSLVTEYTSTELLKKNNIEEDLKDYITLYDFVNLTKKYNLSHIKIPHIINFPIPDENNSKILTFDDIFNIQDIEGFISTHTYIKNEYFKQLKIQRFQRKRSNEKIAV